MKINHDTTIDAKYVSLKGGKIFETKPLKDWLILDLNKKGEILGIEILDASKNLVSIQVDNEDSVNYVQIQRIDSSENNDTGNLEAIIPTNFELMEKIGYRQPLLS